MLKQLFDYVQQLPLLVRGAQKSREDIEERHRELQQTNCWFPKLTAENAESKRLKARVLLVSRRSRRLSGGPTQSPHQRILSAILAFFAV